jgi:antitoxin ParD1/3/4
MQEVMMKAYKTHIIIENPEKVIISNLPFRSGQRVEVVMLAEDEVRNEVSGELVKLLKKTQSLPQIRQVTEEEIALEIAACRSGR